MRHKKLALLALACGLSAGLGTPARATDWPQLQHDAARTGRTTDELAPPYRARWVWLGPTQTLVNTSNTTTFPRGQMPASVNFTIAQSVQPVVSGTRLFVGTMDGGAYGINTADGSTAWSFTLDTGTITTAAVSTDGTIVVFCTLSGKVFGINTSTGAQSWTYQSPGSITGAPAVSGNNVYIADQRGYVTALATANGTTAVWQTRLMQGAKGAPVLGGMAVDGTSVYVGAENMFVYKLAINNGAITNSHRIRGQSFRNQWPMLFNNIVWASSAMTPIIGSEYVGESNQGSTLFADGTSLSNEESNLALWLAANTNGGRWPEAGQDWKHIHALNTSDLSEPFTVLAGPTDGVGSPAHPCVVDNTGRVINYFKTKYPVLTKANGGVFGTAFSIDICGINQTTGHRTTIGSTLANPWPWETDNLYGLTVGGNYLWCRQNFRGTQNFNLTNNTSNKVQTQIKVRDGGDFGAAGYQVIYLDALPEVGTTQTATEARIGPIISGTKVYLTDTYCVTAIEHY